MDSKCGAALYEVAIKTFEDLCFMYPVPEYDEESESLGLGIEAAVAVDFTGQLSGKLVLKVHNDLFYAIATNMLADEAPPTKQQMIDALGEIANIICGNILPRIADSKAAFKLGQPKSLSSSELESLDKSKLLADVHLTLNQGCVDISLFVMEEDAKCERI